MISCRAAALTEEFFSGQGAELAGRGDAGLRDGTWADFAARGIAPAHDRLRFLGRAITPASAPVRFHARFFMADAADALIDDRAPIDGRELKVFGEAVFVRGELAAELALLGANPRLKLFGAGESTLAGTENVAHFHLRGAIGAKTGAELSLDAVKAFRTDALAAGR